MIEYVESDYAFITIDVFAKERMAQYDLKFDFRLLAQLSATYSGVFTPS